MEKLNLEKWRESLYEVSFHHSYGGISICTDSWKNNKPTRVQWSENITMQLFNDKSIEKILDILDECVGFAEDNNKQGLTKWTK